MKKLLNIYLILSSYIYLSIFIIFGLIFYYIKCLINFIARKKIFEYHHPHFFIKLLLKYFFKCLGIDIKINNLNKNKNKIKTNKIIYIFTHTSALEGFVTLSHLNNFPITLGKEDLFKIPIIKDILYYFRATPIPRNNIKEAIKKLKVVENELDKGVCISIAPEGTRRRKKSTGNSDVLLPFKKGAFRMAKNVKCSVVPIVFYGSKRIVNSSIIPNTLTTLYVDVLHEINSEEIEKYDYNELIEKVNQNISENYKKYEDSKIFNGGVGVKYNLFATIIFLTVICIFKLII